MSAPPASGAGRRPPPEPPLWRQAFDAAERVVSPRAEQLVRTPSFATGLALTRRAQRVARDSARGLTARAWHLLNLPAGSDVSRLRAQIGALDREVRRLAIALENERRRAAAGPARPSGTATREDRDADGTQPASSARPRPARRRAQRPAGP